MADTALDATIVASSGGRVLGFAEEVSYGKIRPGIDLKAWRMSGHGLSTQIESFSSNEVTPDRQTTDVRHGVRRVNGPVNIDLSPHSHMAQYEALLGDYWQTPVPVPIATINLTATLVSGKLEVTATTFDFIAAQLFVGAPVTFLGTGSAALNGKKFTVLSHALNKIVLLPPVGFALPSPAVLTAGTFGLKGARVGMGTIVRSFTLEDGYTSIGKFQVFTGVNIGSFTANLPTSGVATGEFGVMGRAAANFSDASLDGAAQVLIDDATMTSLTFDAATGTITRAAGNWITDGFVIGDKVSFSGEGITEVQNRQRRTVIAVTATVLTVEEAIASGVYTSDYYVLKVGEPTYTDVSDEDVLTALSGTLIVQGEPAAVVTQMTIGIDNQMGGGGVVGANFVPFYAFGPKAAVTVNPTVYFGRGGAAETMMNAALNEIPVSIAVGLDTKDGLDGLSFVFGRTVFSPGQLSSGDTGMTASMQGQAAKPTADHPEHGRSQVYIYDTTIAGVAPPTAALDLTYVSQAAGVATMRVTGGVAPYVFDPDGSGGSLTVVTVPRAGEFTYDYNANATFNPIITDSSTPAKSDGATVIITTN